MNPELQKLGITSEIELFYKENIDTSFDVGRVTAEHKERYVIRTEKGEKSAEITGNLRFSAQSKAEFPAVGDWVVLNEFEDMGIIHKVLPRKSVLSRKAVGKTGEEQIIGANIDIALIVMATGNDFNLNRLDRYLAITQNSGITPLVLISKIDLVSPDKKNELVEILQSKPGDFRVVHFSNTTKEGLETIEELIIPGFTYCVIGSSGAGKSTLLNNLIGKEILLTKEISESTGKGKHTTSHRELFILPRGGIIIDTPGMREIGMTSQITEEASTFEQILELAHQCKYADCTHQDEPGCSINNAIEDGRIEEAAFDNYMKIEREGQKFQETAAEKRKKDKAFGKMYKEVISFKKKNR